MGRQTLLQPIEWTKDGWPFIPKGSKTDARMKKPIGESLAGHSGLSDDFTGKSLSLQWQFFDEYDSSRFMLDGKGLILKAKGKTVAECSPLLCMVTSHSYDVQVEMEVEKGASGALVLFYNKNGYSGIGANSKDILTIMSTFQFEVEKDKINKHVFLRLVNKLNTVDMYYSADGIKWKKTENSLEASSINHNVLGGFLSLRIGLCAFGSGEVTFRNFKYSNL
jgi:beta-xylosidase